MKKVGRKYPQFSLASLILLLLSLFSTLSREESTDDDNQRFVCRSAKNVLLIDKLTSKAIKIGCSGSGFRFGKV